MTPDELRVAAVARFKQGKDAPANGDAEEAVSLFQKALELSPESAQVRRTLRDTQRTVIAQRQELPREMTLKLSSLKVHMKVLEAERDWKNLERAAEEAASIDPWDVDVEAMTAAATLGLEYRATAFVFYQRVAKREPTNTTYLRRCASLLELNGQDEKAFEYWHRIQRVDPGHSLARKRVDDGQAKGFVARAVAEKRSSPGSFGGDTVIGEGDTSHGDQKVPAEAMARLSAMQVDPDSGMAPDSGMSEAVPAARRSGPPAIQKGPSGPPGTRSGPSRPPAAGPSRPPGAARPSLPPGAGPTAPPPTVRQPSAGPAARPPTVRPTGASPVAPPPPVRPPGTRPAAAGPAAPPPAGRPTAVPPEAGSSAPPSPLGRSEPFPGPGPSAPPGVGVLPVTAPSRAAADSEREFSVRIPDDVPAHVQNLLSVASSMVARDLSSDACSVLETAFPLSDCDQWIKGMLMVLKRRPVTARSTCDGQLVEIRPANASASSDVFVE